MSNGPGNIQRGIIDAFDTYPKRRFSVRELAARIYLDEEVTRSRTNAIGYSLRQLAPSLGLTRCRIGDPSRFGWYYAWGRK